MREKSPIECFISFPLGTAGIIGTGAIMIGNAAHLMTSHADEGVNVAMHDASKLAIAIVRSAETEGPMEKLNNKVRHFEAGMFSRATLV